MFLKGAFRSAMGDDATYKALTDASRRPPVPRALLSQSIVEAHPEEEFPWTSLVHVKHQRRLYVCQGFVLPKHQMRLHLCHQMRLLSPQRSSLRSLTFARFARTFFNRLNKCSCLKSMFVQWLILVKTLILVEILILV